MELTKDQERLLFYSHALFQAFCSNEQLTNLHSFETLREWSIKQTEEMLKQIEAKVDS
ncbi:MAG: hypothetical protein KGI54_13610 [Pseudomonadota bacterium]|nr:hypothetical protein [Pseudomonadota bacterium]